MTNEAQKPNFERYAYAALAGQFAQSKEEQQYLGGALHLLEKNLDFGEDGIDLYRSYMNEKQIGKLIEIYSDKFQRKLSESKILDLYGWYFPQMEGTSGEQKELIRKEFEKFSGETYGKLMEKIRHLKYLAEEAPESEVGKEAKEQAMKEFKKYIGFLSANNLLQGYTFEGLRQKAVEASKKQNFGGLEKRLKGEMQEEEKQE